MAVNPQEAKELVSDLLKADSKDRMPVILVGHMGDGKSQSMQQAAVENGWNYIDLRLAQQEPGDLIGIPRIDPESGRTVWSKPIWWPADESTKTLIALEELNRAPLDVQQAIMQALTENKLHTHVLPKETQFVVCINPGNDIYQVSELDPAIVNRCMLLPFKSDVDVWLRYAYEKGFDERVIKFIGLNRELLSVPAISGPCPTPRTWELVSRALKVIRPEKHLDAISALVGNKAAVAFKKMSDNNFKVPITGKEILEKFLEVKDKILAQSNADMYFSVKDLLACIGVESVTKPKVLNIAQFLKDIKAEWQAAIINEIPSKILSRMCAVDNTLATTIMDVRKAIETMQ